MSDNHKNYLVSRSWNRNILCLYKISHAEQFLSLITYTGLVKYNKCFHIPTFPRIEHGTVYHGDCHIIRLFLIVNRKRKRGGCSSTGLGSWRTKRSRRHIRGDHPMGKLRTTSKIRIRTRLLPSAQYTRTAIRHENPIR